MTKKIVLSFAALTVLAVVVMAQDVLDPSPRPPSFPIMATVTNFPDPQSVVGTVDVGNLPTATHLSILLTK